MTRKMKLLQNQLSQIEVAENAHKARKKQSDKILKIEDILYVKDARSMTQDRQKLEDEKREETWEKRYLNALKKCYRATKPHRAARIKFVQAYQKKWRVILKQLLKNRRVYNG